MPSCSNPECTTGKPIFARGVCQSCYSRLRRRGTLERAYVVNGGVCTHHGCKNPTFAKNLCQHHYGRAQDPMRYLWRNLRSRYPGQFPDAWETFEGFIADVPPKPNGAIQLRRTDPSRPWASDNMHWQMPITGVTKNGQGRRDYMSAYAKEWSDKTKYGVTKEDRARMMEEQGEVCAICRRSETNPNFHDPERKPRRLNIDHNHKTHKVRGLLCTRCNTMIGDHGACESIETLQSAIDYLRKHSP